MIKVGDYIQSNDPRDHNGPRKVEKISKGMWNLEGTTEYWFATIKGQSRIQKIRLDRIYEDAVSRTWGYRKVTNRQTAELADWVRIADEKVASLKDFSWKNK